MVLRKLYFNTLGREYGRQSSALLTSKTTKLCLIGHFHYEIGLFGSLNRSGIQNIFYGSNIIRFFENDGDSFFSKISLLSAVIIKGAGHFIFFVYISNIVHAVYYYV